MGRSFCPVDDPLCSCPEKKILYEKKRKKILRHTSEGKESLAFLLSLASFNQFLRSKLRFRFLKVNVGEKEDWKGVRGKGRKDKKKFASFLFDGARNLLSLREKKNCPLNIYCTNDTLGSLDIWFLVNSYFIFFFYWNIALTFFNIIQYTQSIYYPMATDFLKDFFYFFIWISHSKRLEIFLYIIIIFFPLRCILFFMEMSIGQIIYLTFMSTLKICVWRCNLLLSWRKEKRKRK